MHYHGLAVMAKYQTPITLGDFKNTAKQEDTAGDRSRLFGSRFDHLVDVNGFDQWDMEQSGLMLCITGTGDPGVCTLWVFGTGDHLLDEYTGTPAGIVATIIDGWTLWVKRDGWTPGSAPAEDKTPAPAEDNRDNS